MSAGTLAHRPTRTVRVAEIRALLPAHLRVPFDEALGDAIDAALEVDDMSGIETVKSAWWGRALVEASPQLTADIDAVARGELDFGPSPFAR